MQNHFEKGAQLGPAIFRIRVKALFLFLCLRIDIVYASELTAIENLESLSRQHSPEILAARAIREEKGAAHHSSWARLFPKIDLRVSQTTSKDSSFLSRGVLPANLGILEANEVSLSGWAVEASFPLFRRNLWVGISEASAASDLALARFLLAEAEHDWRFRFHLGNYLYQIYREAALKSSLEVARTGQRESKARFDLGQKTKIDVLRSEANLVSLESKILSSQQEREAAQNSFLEFTGIERQKLTDSLKNYLSSEDSILKLIEGFSEWKGWEQIEPWFKEEAPVAKKIVESLHLKIIQLEEELSVSQAKLVSSAEWPELYLKATYGKEDRNWGDLMRANPSYSYGIVLNIPLFLGGSLISTNISRRHLEALSKIQRARKSQGVLHEALNQRGQVMALRRLVESQKVTLAKNEEILRLTTKTYELGKATMFELLSSQNELIESKVTLARSRIDATVLGRQLFINLGLEQ